MTPLPESPAARRRLVPYLLVAPAWLVLGLCLLAPLALMLLVSFGSRGTYGGLAPIEDLGGYLASLILDPLKPERIDHIIAAVACLFITLVAIIFTVARAMMALS